MADFLISKLHDVRFMTMLLAAIAASLTVYTLVMPLLAGENMAKRMKAVASERERMRQRERDRLNRNEKVALRQALSCYYSGNFDTGFRHGYVRKVVVAARAVPTAQPKEKV